MTAHKLYGRENADVDISGFNGAVFVHFLRRWKKLGMIRKKVNFWSQDSKFLVGISGHGENQILGLESLMSTEWIPWFIKATILSTKATISSGPMSITMILIYIRDLIYQGHNFIGIF